MGLKTFHVPVSYSVLGNGGTPPIGSSSQPNNFLDNGNTQTLDFKYPKNKEAKLGKRNSIYTDYKEILIKQKFT